MTKRKKPGQDSTGNGEMMVDGVRFSIAPKEAIAFNERILEIFQTLILGHPEAYISDRSLITDFLSMNDLRYAKGPGSRPGYYIFERRWRRGRGIQDLKKRDGFQTKVTEEKGEDHSGRIIRRAKHYFGVDIRPVFDKYFPEILRHISEHLTPARRRALEGDGWVGRRLSSYLTRPTRKHSTMWPKSPAYWFRVRTFISGSYDVYYRRRRPGDDEFAVMDRPYRKAFSGDGFDLPAVRSLVNDWLRARGALPLLPWGRDQAKEWAKEQDEES